MAEPRHMRRAIRLARRGAGRVEPNPMVGCVVVRGDRVVGVGWHGKFGGPHAEVEALRKAGDAARGAEVYVTLEPCCHHGQTPPCTDALIEAEVRRVIIGAGDPNPQVDGGGRQRLLDAGIEVLDEPCGELAGDLIAPFTVTMHHARPYVIAKWAATADGAIATATGDSKWISSESSRQRVHEMRARVDGIVVGIGTVLADDPTLTARGVQVRRVARRIVIDPRLRLPESCNLLDTLDQAPLMVVTSQATGEEQPDRVEALREAGVEVLAVEQLPSGDRPLNLRPMLEHLWRAYRATNVLVEGGAATHGRFLDQQFVDEIATFIAPRVLAGAGHLPPVADALALRLIENRRIDQDVMIRYRVDR